MKIRLSQLKTMLARTSRTAIESIKNSEVLNKELKVDESEKSLTEK